MDSKDFNLTILKECLQLCYSETANHSNNLKEVTEITLIRHIRAIIDSLPKYSGFYRPSYWEPSEEDEKYADQLESNVFQDEDIKFAISSLLASVKFFITKGMTEKSIENSIIGDDHSVAELLTRFMVLALEFSKWLSASSKGITAIRFIYTNYEIKL